MKKQVLSILGLIFLASSAQFVQAAEGGINQSIPYSGTIYDSDGNLMGSGDYKVSFRIYDQPLGGQLLWSEEHDGQTAYDAVECQPLQIVDGRFDVLLGSCIGGATDLDGDPDDLPGNELLSLQEIAGRTELYLEMAIDQNPGAPDGDFEEVFSPRRRIGSSLSAFSALKLVADGNGASTAELLIDSDGELQFIGDDSGVFTMSDSASANGYTFMSIVDPTSQALLTLAGAGDGFAYSAVNLSNADQTRTWALQHRSDSAFNNLNSFFIQEFDGTNFNARLTIKPGGNVGIGTGQPNYPLEVNGVIHSSTGGFRFPDGTTQTTAATGSLWAQNGSDIYYNSGRIGIGTATPAELLHVNTSGNYGTIRFDAGNGSTGGYVFADNEFGFVVLGSRTNTYTRLVRGGAERIGFDATEVVVNQNANNIDFRVEGNADENSLFVNSNSNNVGIGTPNPSGKLQISIVGSGGGGTPGLGEEFRIVSFSPSILLQDISTSTWDYAIINNQDLLTIGRHLSANSMSNDLTIGIDRTGVGTSAPAARFQVGESGDGTFARSNNWATFSDRRWKRDFQDIEGALEKISKIEGRYYYWKSGGDGTRQIGFIAQELQEVLPEVITSDDRGFLSLDYSKLTPVLVEAVKELENKIDMIDLGFDPSVLASESITLAGLTVTGDGRIQGNLRVSGVLTAEGGLRTGVRAVSADETLRNSDAFISVNAGTQSLTLTLPDSTAGHEMVIKKTDASGNTVTIQSESGTIDGEPSVSLDTQYQYLRVIHDAENWFVIGSGTENTE